MRPILLLIGFTFAVSTAHAQSVRWQTADSGDPAELQLVFEGCSPEGDPQLPRIEGTTLTLQGRSEQTSIVNFSVTRSTILSYRARSQRSGPVQIPAFNVQTNQGSLRVPAFTGGATRSASDANVFSRLEPGAPTVWAGQVFPLTYVLDVARRAFNQLGTNIEWDPAPLVVEEWSKFEPAETTANGESRLQISAHTRAYAKSPGPLTLNAANQLVNLQSGSIGFGLFQTPRIEQLSVTSNQPSLVVRPLPPPATGFTGAVGQFKLTSKVVPTTATVGEPVTWTLELSGVGNWPDIAGLPQREVANDFNVVQPQAKRTPAEGKLFDVTLSEDVVLVPTRAGNYTLGPIAFTYFDPASGTYKTINTPRTSVTISAPLAPTGTAAPSPRSTNASSDAPPSRLDVKLPPPPASPNGLPRDPLPGSASALAPFRSGTLALFVAAPFALLPFLWLWLAIQRARETDPARVRREAKQRLAATLAQLRSATTSSSQPSALSSQLLLAWQHDTAVLWDIPHAAPSARAFEAGPDLRAGHHAAAAATWSQLWLESDRALYSSDTALPSDWIARAEAALAAKPVPPFSPLNLFRPRNLFPFVATLALFLTLASSLPAQETQNPTTDPAAAYRSGDFSTAAKIWTDTLAQNPTDSIARHNLSLALAQQDRWGEAAAHAAAAFVQNPSSDAVRWQLALAAEKAGYLPAPLAAFFPAGPLQSLARIASPTRWQIVLVGSATAAALALGIFIVGAYHPLSRRRTIAALTTLSLSLLLGAFALASLRAYDLAAHPSAVIAWRAGTLRSIPTEADNTQKTTVLPAGSVALADDRAFLGWTRLTFDNGQTGWVRKEEVVPLWQ